MGACTTIGPAGVHPLGCGCRARLGRRGLLQLAAAVAASSSLGAGAARAASGQYEAMLLNCIDPRFTSKSLNYMHSRGISDRYSQFVIAGGPIGVTHPRFASWHATFWDNLGVSLELHHIHSLIGLTHRDCGAANIAYGPAAVATPEAETATHTEALHVFRAEALKRHPQLNVVTAIMALDGSVHIVT